MKALGATRREIVRQFAVESLAIGLIGGIAGWLLGLAMARGDRARGVPLGDRAALRTCRSSCSALSLLSRRSRASGPCGWRSASSRRRRSRETDVDDARMSAMRAGRVSDKLVRLEGVSRHFGALRALDDVDLEIRRGEWLAVMGPSGSGKSTLVNLLGALDRPTDGPHHGRRRRDHALDESERVRLPPREGRDHLPAVPSVPLPHGARERHGRAALPLDGRRERGRRGARARRPRRSREPSALAALGRRAAARVRRARAHQPARADPRRRADRQPRRRERGPACCTLLRELHAEGHTLVTVTHAPQVGNLADRRVELHHGRLADLTVPSEEIERRYDEVLVQMWTLAEEGRVPEAARVKIPDVVDNRRTLQGMVESGLDPCSRGETLEFTPRGRGAGARSGAPPPARRGAVLLGDAPARSRGRARRLPHGAHHRPRGHEQHLLVPRPSAPVPARQADPGRRLLRAADHLVSDGARARVRDSRSTTVAAPASGVRSGSS